MRAGGPTGCGGALRRRQLDQDAGLLLLSRVDQRVGLLAAAARCMPDPRNPLLITHAVHEMLRQRVYGLALGWEDLNDPLVAQRCRQCKRPWKSTERALFCGQQLLCALLRPSRIEAAKHAAAVLKLSCW